MANGALGRRDLFDGRLTNSRTKLIFRIIEGRSWPTRENSGANLMVHSYIIYVKSEVRTLNTIKKQYYLDLICIDRQCNFFLHMHPIKLYDKNISRDILRINLYK